jgi:hypothetical protein
VIVMDRLPWCPTNGVGGLFILSYRAKQRYPSRFISRARLAAARRAREMNR